MIFTATLADLDPNNASKTIEYPFTKEAVNNLLALQTLALQQTNHNCEDYTFLTSTVAAADLETWRGRLGRKPDKESTFLIPELIKKTCVKICDQRYGRHLQDLNYGHGYQQLSIPPGSPPSLTTS